MCFCRLMDLESNTLDCGGCLLDASFQPIMAGCALHELFHRSREVDITSLVPVLRWK